MKFLLPVLLFFCQSALSQTPLYKQKSALVEVRINDLLGRMNLEDKILQLNQYVAGENDNANNIGLYSKNIPAGIGSLIFFSGNPVVRNILQKKAMDSSRLGIPILFGFDVIHGCRTIYPISLAQACSWNPMLVKQNAEMAARESVLSGINWVFSPMIDVARDPRWGRVAEGYGEDPYANAVFGVATVKGYQGRKLSAPYSVAACLKHYIGYSMSEGGRDYRYAEVSPQSLWETFMPPYEQCVQAGAATLMSAFTDLSGIPASANRYTLTDVLKGKWKHDGFVVSDWDAIKQLIFQGVAADPEEAALKAFLAGVDMDMKDELYETYLKTLVDEKKVPLRLIDSSVARVLRVKFRLGLFENPYTEVLREEDRYLQPESKALAAKLAEESIVLLKNKNGVLPFSASIKSLAVIGPMAKDQENICGAWTGYGRPQDVETIYDGLQQEFSGKVQLAYARGCDFDGNDEDPFAEALAAAKNADAVLLCLGEKRNWSGENGSRSSIALPGIQERLMEKLKQSGKPVVLVLSNGRPLELIRLEPLADAIIEIWQPGVAGGLPLAGILSGRINPSGKLSITFPLVTGQIPIYYNMRQSSRPFSKMGDYQDVSTEPLYRFGYGLSYTTFAYNVAKISATQFKKNQKLTVEVTVKNTGNRSGKETVHWFISDPVASISRPVKELKFFEKKAIAPGESALFRFNIEPMRDLSYPDATGRRILEEGIFYVHVNDQKIKMELVK